MTNTTHAYFDLKDYIQSLGCIDVAAQMAQSVAFRIDVILTGAVRQLMKNLRVNHVDHGIDSISEMTSALSEMNFAEEIFAGAGKDELGPVATILQMSAVRDIWQDLCGEMTGMTFDYRGVPRTWDVQCVEDVLRREATLKVKPETTRRIKVQVQRRAGDASAEDIEAVIARRIALEESKAQDASRALNSQTDTLVTLYGIALMQGVATEENVDFYELSADVRRQLIDAAMKGAARAEEFATSSSSITDAEFDAINFAVIKIERELKAVLAGPAYAVQRAMASI